MMNFLDKVMEQSPEFQKIESFAYGKNSVLVTGVTEIHKANIIGTLCRKDRKKCFCIVSNEREGQQLTNDLCSMGIKAYFYPVRDFIFADVSGKSREYEHKRIEILLSIITSQCEVVVACADAAMQFTIPMENLEASVLSLMPGKEISPDKCCKILSTLGYENCANVEGKGQFSRRGGILDFFPPESDCPVRAEFWGDEIDTLNFFDIETQRRTESCENILLAPSTEILVSDNQELAGKIRHKADLLKGKNSALAKERLYREADDIENNIKIGSMDKFIGLVYEKTATLLDYADDNTVFFVSELINVRERIKGSEFRFSEDLKEYFSDGILCRGFETYSISHGTFDEILSENTCIYLDNFSRGGYDIRLDALVPFTAKQLSPWNGSVTALCDDLEGITLKNKAIVILAGTEKAAANVASLLRDRNYNAVYSTNLDEAEKGIIYVTGGSLSSGFEYPSLNFMLITHSLIPAKPSKKRKTIKSGEAIYSLSELTPGDYVVHSTHGIGIFGGIHKIDTQGIVKDYIKISYAKGDVLYVPVTQLDLVSKYIGPKENSTVKISRLGGTEWQKAKTRVKAAVKDMAKELIALYSARMSAKGHAFSADTEWQKDFEACFEYEETPDQLRCIDEIKGDMEKTAPMDRLLCGDVGFGKTEVALRAAFKCVCDSKQCALLCPTTILAWQHYQTALKRFDGYPIRIELLSRFRTAKQQKDILEKLERGEIDIIIGTHRLVQKDVKFRDPGLVIIDEEQRFGVAQKEKFKEWYKNIDVLTLSATPIPRTLNMAMSGIRDMSVIEEAPQDRQPVQTYVLEHDEAVINEAIRRELRRGGQVFYLHNRVDSIDSLAASIAKRIPEASVGVGHGKMSEHQLSKVWEEMLEQKINVLVCTTIIETGVDLPNANTLIIENADCMGLSQLHQLRGRVGRSSRRAYAYLTFNRSKVLSDISQKRLNAIREFTEFGSGFKIAMRDLELRGAGNILGAKQHGHMEDVGYDMYLKLLGDAVKEEKGEKTTNPEIDCLIDVAVQAHIPESYISDLSTRLDAYRRIADIRNDEDAHDVTDEFIDRFGEPPQSVVGLIDIALIRNMANAFGVYEIRQNDSGFLLYLRNIKSEEAMDIVVKNAGKAFLNAGKKPYILIKASKSEKPLEFLLEVFTNLKK